VAIKRATRVRVIDLIQEKEKREGIRIKYADVERATGLSRSVVRAYALGLQTRFDAHTVDALMAYFGITSYDEFFEKKVIGDDTQTDG
jgi:transcriptional regulator with XRE-family HTH domain